ncbi:Transcriptional regulatory protein moc3 [Fusarium oxysporum f. sp. cubense race 1]|uniref:Transcriptional regulatory protein moc3 n=1 Tax=Fusarium oxysporum f. sp. cubense (strain race 1) TaxID=1229664 RepID=N4UHU9_FUSC1|nr:Transcriptional regulatory protein moc3 [Fusarium oxysporum f. sp. cubense race 1]
MVNYGVSRACETCKKRRKKCDETRPACLRCVKSRRRCPGYKDNTSLLFRHYQPSTPPLERWHPSNDFILEVTALDIFLDSLVVQSRDRSHSRGFLDGMHYLFATSAPTSTLMRAARIVVLSSLANRYRRDSLMSLVRRQYGQVLVDYTTDLSQQTASPSVEHFFTAVLLGLYEVSFLPAVE